MNYTNEYNHLPFLRRELGSLLVNESFAARMPLAIGSDLHYRLVEYTDQEEVEYSRLYPAEALFMWAIEDGGLDPEWLESVDGGYFGDNGDAIPSDIKPSLSAVDQLAAYGLYLISDDEMNCLGSVPDQGENENFFTRDAVIEHRASNMLNAYQSLSYCQRILKGVSLTNEEKAASRCVNFASLGRAGAQKRHAPMLALRSWAIARRAEGKINSANRDAHRLKDAITAHGISIGAFLSKDNAQRTIAEWFRKST